MLPVGILERLLSRKGITPDVMDRSLPPPPVIESTPAPVTRVPMGAGPVMITRSGGGRPVGAVGEDPLVRDQALLESQQNYKAPFSKKDFALKSLFSFLQGGLPGLALGAADYAANQGTRNRMAVGGDIANTQNQIKQQIFVRKSVSDLLSEQADRNLKAAQTEKMIRPEREPGFTLPEGGARYDSKGNLIISRPSKPEKEGSGFNLGPGEARYDAQGNLVVQREPKPEKPEEIPDTASWQEKEQGHRKNATEAQAYADKKQAELSRYIKENPGKFVDEKGNPRNPETDVDAAAIIADIKSHRDFAAGEIKNANEAYNEKIKANSKKKAVRGMSRPQLTIPKSDPLGLFK